MHRNDHIRIFQDNAKPDSEPHAAQEAQVQKVQDYFGFNWLSDVFKGVPYFPGFIVGVTHPSPAQPSGTSERDITDVSAECIPASDDGQITLPPSSAEPARNAALASPDPAPQAREEEKVLHAENESAPTRQEQAAPAAFERQARQRESAPESPETALDVAPVDHSGEISGLRNLLAERDAAVAKLEQKLTANDKALSSANAELKQARNKLAALAKESAAAKTHSTERERQYSSNVEALQRQIERMTKEAEAAKASMNAQLNDFQAKLKSAAGARKALQDKLAVELGEKDRCIADAREAATQFERDLEEHKQKLSDRFEELAELTRILEERDAELAELRKTLEERDAELDERTSAESEMVRQHDQLSEQVAVLQDKNEKLAAELDGQARRVEERFKEVAALTTALREREQTIADQAAELKMERERHEHMHELLEAHISLSSPPFADPPAARNSNGKHAPQAPTVRQQIEMLAKSPIFDREWYLEQYPDVVERGMDPVEHYVLHGASEGRQPGPNFDTEWYRTTYPDVAAGMNPAIHYLVTGKNEGRRSCGIRGTVM